MIPRSKSFSRGGANIERVMQIEKYRADPSQLSNMLRPRMNSQPAKAESSQQLSPMNAFDKVPGREKPNSFLLHNVKDSNTKLSYEDKKNVVMTKTAFLPFRRQKDERLSFLMSGSKKAAVEQSLRQTKKPMSCLKFQSTENDSISISRDLQKARKTFHNLDFEKQTERPFNATLRKQSIQTEKNVLTRSKSTNMISRQNSSFRKTDKIHSFASYTKRDFLTEKKVRGMPEVSGIDWYKINPEKFKSHWKTVNPPKFEVVSKKSLSRYDRDCPHWYTQLTYNVKNNEKTAKNNIIFGTQTSRKGNEVKSTYPMRIAL